MEPAKKVKEKPERRKIAEESIINSISLMTTLCAAHVIPVHDGAEAETPAADNWIGQKAEAYFRRRGAAGIRMVEPGLVLNLDATTIEAHTKTVDHSERIFFKARGEAGKRRAVWELDVSAPDVTQFLSVFKGVSGSGQNLRTVVVVKGLADSELPSSKVADGVYVTPVTGFGVGAGANPDMQGEGYVVWVRGDTEGALKIVYRWYMANIIRPFLADRRNELMQDQGGWRPGVKIPDQFRAVVWFDGKMNQINSVVREDEVEVWAALNTEVCKVPACMTGTSNPKQGLAQKNSRWRSRKCCRCWRPVCAYSSASYGVSKAV